MTPRQLRDADHDDICRAHDDRTSDPCPRCSYIPAKAPAWATHGVTFAINGKAYRIVSVGSTNRYAPGHLHFEDTILAEPLSEHWSLPNAPCPVSDFKTALDSLFGLPSFRPHELSNALVSHDPQATP